MATTIPKMKSILTMSMVEVLTIIGIMPLMMRSLMMKNLNGLMTRKKLHSFDLDGDRHRTG